MVWLWFWLAFNGTTVDDGTILDASPKTPAPRPDFAVEALPLDETNFAQWRDYVLPDASEKQHEEIPWRLELGGAIRESHETGKPILLWAMNGHPFGCT